MLSKGVINEAHGDRPGGGGKFKLFRAPYGRNESPDHPSRTYRSIHFPQGIRLDN